MNEVNLSGVKISDHFIALDENKINLWQLSIGAVKADKAWSEKSDRATPRIRPEMSSAYVVRTRMPIDPKTREKFLEDLKSEYLLRPTWRHEDLFVQMMAEGKLPRINGKEMKLKTFVTYCQIMKREGIKVENLSDAIMALYFSGEKRSTTIAHRLACSKTTVYEIFRKNGVNVKPYRHKVKE